MAFDSNQNPARVRSPIDGVISYAAFVGAGAASPTIPTAAQAALLLPATLNMATPRGTTVAVVITRTGVGDHTFTFEPFASPAQAFYVSVMLTGATAALDSRVLTVTMTAGRLAVRVLTFIDNGTDTDMASGTDFMTIRVEGSNSRAS